MFSSVQEGEQAEHGDSALRLELAQLQARRMLRTLAVVQDLADALLALNDVRGARPDLAPCCLQHRRLAGRIAVLVRADGRDALSRPPLPCLAGLQVKGSAGIGNQL